MKIIELESDRILLRQWRDEDLLFFREINSDPEVMKYYPNILSEDESDAMGRKLKSLIEQRGWGFWGLEIKEYKKFVGFVGLHIPNYELPVEHCVEIGWRLAKEFWGKGYATEAAMMALDCGFNTLNLEEIYSFTPVINEKSWRVMDRIGMYNTNSNFMHPIVPEGHKLSEHVLYKINKHQHQRIIG